MSENNPGDVSGNIDELKLSSDWAIVNEKILEPTRMWRIPISLGADSASTVGYLIPARITSPATIDRASSA